MAENLARKIIGSHLAKPSELKVGDEIYLKFDQTLTHDINAVMCYLAFEGIGIPRVKTECSVSYLDHNLLYVDSKTPDDHIFLQTLAQHYGIYLSRPGNGIMHSVQLARFGAPGKTSLGTDSHTPSGGAIGMFAIGGGGMDCATVMAGIPLRLTMPKIVRVNLTGSLKPGVAAKDVILEMLRRYSVKGGLGRIYEYVGPGVLTLEVPARATIANMGAELGATTSIFPADEVVRKFMRAQGREDQFTEMLPDVGCEYDEEIEINLSELEPLVACPDQPDRVKKVSEVEKLPVQQVFFGSCTNGSYQDIAKAALVLKGRHVNPNVSCTCGISTKQIFKQLMHDGYIDMLLDAGVRITEISCGACCGIGQSPATNAVSVRTSNRNFKGRSGNPTAKLYLVSPETAAISAITGVLTDGRKSGLDLPDIEQVDFDPNDNFVVYPTGCNKDNTEVVMGPNIKPFPRNNSLPEDITARVVLHAGDNITTDDIMPSDSRLLPYRSNIPHLSEYCFEKIDKGFPIRCNDAGKCVIVGGENYGQGSSREHAALAPLYLGIKFVLAKSFARIHRSNLINSGILPLVFADPADYETLSLGDDLVIENAREQVENECIVVKNITKGIEYKTISNFSELEKKMILNGGKINTIKKEM